MKEKRQAATQDKDLQRFLNDWAINLGDENYVVDTENIDGLWRWINNYAFDKYENE